MHGPLNVKSVSQVLLAVLRLQLLGAISTARLTILMACC